MFESNSTVFFFPSRFLIKNLLQHLECEIELEYSFLRKQLLFLHQATGDSHGETTESLVGNLQYPIHRHERPKT